MKKLLKFLLFSLSVSLVLPGIYPADKGSKPVSENTTAEENYQKGKVLYDKKKYKEAYPWLLKAAEAGHSDAQMHLGKMFFNGWGVPHDHKKGKEWHEKAAAQGNKESIEKLKKMEH